jgi:Helix-turn-helix domain
VTPGLQGRELGNQAPNERIVGQPFNPYKLFPGILIPEPVCKYKGLSPGAKLIYGRLIRYAGENGAAYPSISTLGSEIGIGETQTRGYIRELEKQLFIEVDRENRHFRRDGSGGSNGYVFLWHTAFLGEQGALRKTPPPLRKTEGVSPRITEPLTPSDNRTRRESVFSRESGKENQSTSDYQRTNRTNRDSHAGRSGCTTEVSFENRIPIPARVPSKPASSFTDEERTWMSDAISSYGRRRTMRQHMQESAPPPIVTKCLEAAGGTPLRDIGEILRYKCVNRGLEPGTSKGPQGWGWFPAVIAGEVRERREQSAAAADPNRKTRLSDFPVATEIWMERATSAFDTLDDLGATA